MSISPNDHTSESRNLHHNSRGRLLSRRAFLAVSGVALSSTAFAEQIQTEPTVDIDDDGLGGQILKVIVGGHYTWKLWTGSFCSVSDSLHITEKPHFTLSNEEENGSEVFKVSLLKARIPGTDLKFRIDAKIYNPGNGWLIDLKLNGRNGRQLQGNATPPLLVEWIAGLVSLEYTHPDSIPSKIHVGGLRVDQRDSKQSPTITLQCVGIDGDLEESADKNRVLRSSVHGELQAHFWFPGDLLQINHESKISFTKAAIDLRPPNNFANSSPDFSREFSCIQPPVNGLSEFDTEKPYAIFSLFGVEASDKGCSLANVKNKLGSLDRYSYSLEWSPDLSEYNFRLISFDRSNRSRDAIVHLNSKAVVTVRGNGMRPCGGRLYFENLQILALASEFHDRISICATLASNDSSEFRSSARLFETDYCSFVIEGRNCCPESEEAHLVQITCRRAKMHSLAIPIRLLRAHVPAAGVSLATLMFANRDGIICIGERVGLDLTAKTTLSTTSNEINDVCEAPEWTVWPVIHLHEVCTFSTSLENSQLLVKRSCDIFDLAFEFKSYWLKSEHGITWLDRRIPAKFQSICNCPTLVAVFPPQHVQEQVFGIDHPLTELDPPDELAKTLISNATRVAMQGMGDRDDPSRHVFQLTIENLTDWHDLALAVHRRALPEDADFEAQLAAVGLRKEDHSRDDAKTLWREAMLEIGVPQNQSIYKFVTQIEAVTGLIVSPDKWGTFEVPRFSSRERMPVWSARLGTVPAHERHENSKNQCCVLVSTEQSAAPVIATEEPCVRVIHARNSNLGFFTESPCDDDVDFVPFCTTLTARDRAELLTLTSGFSLPSLRRLQRDDNQGYEDDPKGMVFLPPNPEEYTFLCHDTETYQVADPNGSLIDVDVPQEGLLVPKPFREYSLSLSALKANLKSNWTGEPPAPLVPNDGSGCVQFYKEALNIEGYQHRTTYGRDAFVQVSYKGFLFPLGHRAALIKISERPFSPARGNTDLIDPTAYLIKRNFICCQKPSKSFPALGQPFAGREFPTASVELITVTTPDIIDPNDDPNQLIKFGFMPNQGHGRNLCSDEGGNSNTVGRCFWPRTAKGTRQINSLKFLPQKGDKELKPQSIENRYGNEVHFEYLLDESSTPVISPLIFVDNTAAHDPTTMQALVDYYNNLGNPASASGATEEDLIVLSELRTAMHGNTLRKYAPNLQSGETSFLTNRWLLGASGTTGTNLFRMDALMEGADQPPFYPLMDRGFIKMQSLDRLMGRDQGLIETSFNQRYLQNALDPSGNPSEIFLDVVDPPIDLNLTGQGQSAGGVAQPSARLAAISRKTGMVGGRPRHDTEGNSKRKRITVVSKSLERIPGDPKHRLCDFDAAEAGRFDPAEFLGGGLADAKLLGIVPLKDIVRVVAVDVAPQLREVEVFAEEGIRELQDVASQASESIEDARLTMTESLKVVWNSDDPLAELYPELSHRMVALKLSCDEFAKAPPKEAILLVGKVISAAKTLLKAINETVKKPIPEALVKYIEQVRLAVKRFSDLCTLKGLADYVSTYLKTEVDEFFKAVLDELSDVLEVVFGTSAISEILQHPDEAIDELLPTAYFEAFAMPLLERLSRIVQLIETILGRINWSRTRLARELANVLADGNLHAATKLCPGLNSAKLRHNTRVTSVKSFVSDLDSLADDLSRNLIELITDLEYDVQAVVNDLYNRVEGTVETGINDTLKPAVESAKTAAETLLDSLRDEYEAAVTASLNEALSIEDRRAAQKRAQILQAKVVAAEQEFEVLKNSFDALASPNSAAGRKLRERIKDSIKAEWELSVRRMCDEIKSLSRQTVEDAFARLLSGFRGVLASLHPFATFIRLAEKLQAALLNPTGMLNELIELFDPLTMLSEEFDEIHTLRESITAAHTELVQRIAGIRREVTNVKENIRLLDSRAVDFGEKIDDLLTAPSVLKGKESANALSILLQQRRKLIDSLHSLALVTAETIYYVDNLITQHTKSHTSPPELTVLKSDLKKVFEKCFSLASAVISKNVSDNVTGVAAALNSYFPGLVSDGTTAFAEAQTAVANAISSPDFNPAAISGVFNQVIVATENFERKIIGALTAGLAAINNLPALLTGYVNISGHFEDVLDLAILIHTQVFDALTVLYNGLSSPSSTEGLNELIASVAAPGLDSINQARTAVEQDRSKLQVIKSNVGSTANLEVLVNDLNSFVGMWTEGEPGLVKAARIMSRMTQSLLSGQLDSFVDLNALRAILEEMLYDLIPTKFFQSYDWDTELGDFPPSSPIFLMDRSAAARDLRRKNADDLDVKENDLVLVGRVTVDLRKGTREASAIGQIAPFKIRLLGDAFDLLTIGFNHATFKADTSGASKFDVEIGEVQIGEQLKFIKALQSYFSPNGNGPYITVSPSPPAVEVGYQFSRPIISIGAISFLNIGMSVSMLLPFDQRPALFRFSFASRESPFLISVFPYGGGGFVGLIANATGIVGFEISFEFGAMVAIDIAVLKGQGRITAGIYLRILDGEWMLEGFVKAVGAGHILCFGLGINMEVGLRQEKAGAMAGRATYGFQFSLGVLKKSFSVTMEKRVSNSKSLAKSNNSRPNLAATAKAILAKAETSPRTVLKTPSKHKKWRDYRRHLAI
jgi:hypothetical protein